MGTKIEQKIAIDSLKIRVHLSDVKIINESLQSKWLLINEKTGEQDESFFKANSYKVSKNGISTRFGIENQQTASQKIQPFIVILFNSKLLKDRYFEGITIDNIESLYNDIINMGVVSFTYKSFLNAECTDVDFKQDGTISIEGFSKSLKKIEEFAKPSKKKNQGYKSFNQANNKGIEFSDRRTTSCRSNPFLKIYHKGIELNNKSMKFANDYLSSIDYTDIVRIECTVKNKAHFKYLGINDTTLHNLLNLSLEVKKSIITSAIKKHLEPRVIEIKNQSELKPDKMIIYNLIVALMYSGHSFETIKTTIALSGIDCKVKRSQKGKEIEDIYVNFIKDSALDKTTKEVDNFLNFIGWS